MVPTPHKPNLFGALRRSQAGQAVVELVVAIPILIALFGACLQLLHLGIAHIVVELAAYEATRLATLDNMNIAEARRTAEDICRVLGPGLTEVKYQSNPPGYEIIHHLRPIVPIIRELTVKHSLPSYVFLPGYELEPGSAVSPGQNRGGGGGGSPGYGGGRGGRGSGIEVADYDPDDYPNGGYSRSTYSSSQETYPQYAAAANPQPLPRGLEPYHADYSQTPDDDLADLSASYDPSDADLSIDPSQTSPEDNSSASLSAGSGASAMPGFLRTTGDYLAAGASAAGRSIWPMPLLPTDTIAEAGKRAREKTGREEGAAAGEGPEQDSILPESLDKDTTGVEAFGKGFAEASLGDTHEDDAYLPTHRWANQATQDYRDKSSRYREALDDMDKEADKEKGLKKITDKAKIKATKAAVAGSNLLAEAALDIPKAGQDLPEAGRNTADAAKKLAKGDLKGALRSGGRAVGLLGREAGRLSIVGGISRKAGKKLLKEGGEEVADRASVTAGKQVYSARKGAGETQSILEGINPELISKESRFGRAFYVAEKGETAIAEISHHGKDATHVIRYELDVSKAKVLDLSETKVAKKWGYKLSEDYGQSQAIAEKAKQEGYNVIKYKSLRGEGNNYAVVDDFNELLKPQMVSPAK